MGIFLSSLSDSSSPLPIPINQDSFDSFDLNRDGLLFGTEFETFYQRCLLPWVEDKLRQSPKSDLESKQRSNGLISYMLPHIGEQRLWLLYFDQDGDGTS